MAKIKYFFSNKAIFLGFRMLKFFLSLRILSWNNSERYQ